MLRHPPLPVERLADDPEHPLGPARLRGEGLALVAGRERPGVDGVPRGEPGVVLVAAHRADQPDQRVERGEHLHDPRAPLDLAVHPLLDVVGPHPDGVLAREVQVGERRRPRLLEQLGAARVDGRQQVAGLAVAGADERGVALGERRLEGRHGRVADVAPAAAVAHVALEVRDAALPGRVREGLADRAGEPLEIVVNRFYMLKMQLIDKLSS